MNLHFFILIIALGVMACNATDEKSEDIKASQTLINSEATVVIGMDTLPIDRSISYLMGAFDPALHPHFVLIDTIYADRPNLYLRKDAYQAFTRMYKAAKEAGILLVIRSATRNFEYQKSIWERKWRGETKLSGNIDASKIASMKERALAILRYSSMPGTSRHHWGTDIDLNAFTNSYFESGKGLKLYQWLQAHARDYGFCQPYTAKGPDRPFGYHEEKWHWSYLPVSDVLLKEAKTSLNNAMILGFEGSEAAQSIDVVSKYVLGINPLCDLTIKN